jgi:hypothetical protein
MAGSIPNNGTNTKNYSLRNGLQWYWDLSSADATITDQHSRLVLTRGGTVNTLANGAPDGGSCIDFPTGGISNFRNASIAPLDSYSESYTVNIWVRNVAISPNFGNWYINHTEANINNYFQITTFRNPNPSIMVFTTDKNAISYNIQYPYTLLNEWFMLTMVVRNHTVEMWVNGSIYGSQVRVMEQTTGNAPFAIGNAAWSQTSSLQHQGQLFAAGVWNRALLPIDIKRLYNGGTGRRYINL